MQKQYQERKKAVLELLQSAQNEFSLIQKENRDGIARIEVLELDVSNFFKTN